MNINDILQKDKLITTQFLSDDIIERLCYTTIPTNQKCVGLVGLRGVGKTSYLLRQRISTPESIYISCDLVSLRNNDLFSLIESLFKTYGIKTFFLDEIHYLNNRDGYIKNIIDFLPVHIVFSGSSMIDITQGGYDLSRRVLLYHIPCFSFAEYMQIRKGIILPSYTFDDILNKHINIAIEHSIRFTNELWNEYLHYGQFGYRYTDRNSIIFERKLDTSIKKIINEDIANVVSIGTENLNKITDLLVYLCNGAGTSAMTTSTLATKLTLNHKTADIYVDFLEKAGVVHRIYSFGTLSDNLRKAKKLFPSSTNILYLFGNDIGFVRESLFVSCIQKLITSKQLSKAKISYQAQTDFVIEVDDKKYFFEIGGKSKSRSEKNLFIIKDDIIIGQDNNIPLRLFGLL